MHPKVAFGIRIKVGLRSMRQHRRSLRMTSMILVPCGDQNNPSLNAMHFLVKVLPHTISSNNSFLYLGFKAKGELLSVIM